MQALSSRGPSASSRSNGPNGGSAAAASPAQRGPADRPAARGRGGRATPTRTKSKATPATTTWRPSRWCRLGAERDRRQPTGLLGNSGVRTAPHPCPYPHLGTLPVTVNTSRIDSYLSSSIRSPNWTNRASRRALADGNAIVGGIRDRKLHFDPLRAAPDELRAGRRTNVSIPLFLVAPEEKREKVLSQVNHWLNSAGRSPSKDFARRSRQHIL